ncbi:MAG: DMT family transporter [Candidatus Cryptobacteroides sp.]
MMKNGPSNTFFHVLAIVIVAIWGLTFISTKVLLQSGLSPEEIFLVRFAMAYLGMWGFCLWGRGGVRNMPADTDHSGPTSPVVQSLSCPSAALPEDGSSSLSCPSTASPEDGHLSRSSHSPWRLFCGSVRDELLLAVAGVMGGSLYFWSENTALQYTLASNVSFIVCTTPLVTAFLNAAVRREKIGRLTLLGGCLALSGIALIAFSGGEGFHLGFVGDTLALLASLTWALYTIVTKGLLEKYPSAMVSRKVFFYGLLTIIPVILLKGWSFPLTGFMEPKVLLNILFLGAVASLGCYALWNVVIKKLGTVGSSNYIYLNPLFTLLGATIVLGERMTLFAIIGCAVTLAGVWIASRET